MRQDIEKLASALTSRTKSLCRLSTLSRAGHIHRFCNIYIFHIFAPMDFAFFFIVFHHWLRAPSDWLPSNLSFVISISFFCAPLILNYLVGPYIPDRLSVSISSKNLCSATLLPYLHLSDSFLTRLSHRFLVVS